MKPYLEYAETLINNTGEVIKIAENIQKYINKNLVSEVYHPSSILESRFTPGEIAFALKMRSCGAVTNIATEMLRHIGYTVKKVHGSTPVSVDHAWIKVEDSDKIWVSLDLSQEEMTNLKGYVVIAECGEWEEINDIILKAHLRFISE